MADRANQRYTEYKDFSPKSAKVPASPLNGLEGEKLRAAQKSSLPPRLLASTSLHLESQSTSRCGGAYYLPVNSSGVKLIKLRRQTIQVCAPGVSMSVNAMSFDFSQALNLRLSSMRWSLVPQAIHSTRSCEACLASSAGKAAA